MERPLPDVEREFLDCIEGERLVRIQRLRLAGGSPYCHILNYLPTEIGERVEPKALVTKPLLQILEEDLQKFVARADQTFQATVVDTESADLLAWIPMHACISNVPMVWSAFFPGCERARCYDISKPVD